MPGAVAIFLTHLSNLFTFQLKTPQCLHILLRLSPNSPSVLHRLNFWHCPPSVYPGHSELLAFPKLTLNVWNDVMTLQFLLSPDLFILWILFIPLSLWGSTTLPSKAESVPLLRVRSYCYQSTDYTDCDLWSPRLWSFLSISFLSIVLIGLFLLTYVQLPWFFPLLLQFFSSFHSMRVFFVLYFLVLCQFLFFISHIFCWIFSNFLFIQRVFMIFAGAFYQLLPSLCLWDQELCLINHLHMSMVECVAWYILYAQVSVERISE